MQFGPRSFLLVAAALLMLSGCDFNSPWGSSSSGSQYGDTSGTVTGTGGTAGTADPPAGVGRETSTQGSDDTAIATASLTSASVAVGASQTISITFTSSDGLPITGFGISGSLSTLPAGWSGPASFTCALVATGSGCVLNLTYAPTAADSGSLAIDFVYIDNAGLSKAPGGSITIPYQAIPADNVVATASPTGQINAAVGSGTETVSVNFTTDTNNATEDDAATNLTVTSNLAALPAGWASAAPSFACAIVSSGSGCQLVLTYQPTAAGRGTLTLDYSYTDDTGAARVGTVNIPYSTTSADTVVGSAAPTGQINAVINAGGEDVAVTFTTDDGKSASNLAVTSSLSRLPAGWHSAAGGFTCGSVSTGNGCQLHLTYAPTALGSGTLTLTYAYENDAGTEETGTLNIPYQATTNDTVRATAAPSGQINAVVGMGSQNVAVVFTTNDGRLATGLQVTSNLADLPPGWSSTDNALACASVSSGHGCELNLSYTPAEAAAGTLKLTYSYKNNANQAKTGSLNIPYRATTNDSIAGTANPGSALAVLTGSSTPVSITFATDDGNPASALAVTSGLSALPAGWSGTSAAFTCATVSAGTPCALALTYAPTTVGNGTLSIGFSYVNDAGFPGNGTVNITYRANSNDTVGATSAPTPLVVAATSTQSVVVTFVTSDGNPASALSVTSGLTALPGDWAGPASFTCTTISAGTPCQLTLSYQPLVPESGSITLAYTYTNNAGLSEQGSVSIPYSSN